MGELIRKGLGEQGGGQESGEKISFISACGLEAHEYARQRG
jgi:hypothetical protein